MHLIKRQQIVLQEHRHRFAKSFHNSREAGNIHFISVHLFIYLVLHQFYFKNGVISNTSESDSSCRQPACHLLSVLHSHLYAGWLFYFMRQVLVSVPSHNLVYYFRYGYSWKSVGQGLEGRRRASMAVMPSILRWKKYNFCTFAGGKKYRNFLLAVHVGDWWLFSYSTTVRSAEIQKHLGKNSTSVY